MKFSEFPHAWLRENYCENAVDIDKNGDFSTAVSMGDPFGILLTKHFLDLIDKKVLKLPLELVEIGVNEGYLSRDFSAVLLESRPEISSKLSSFIIRPYERLGNLQKKTSEGVEFTHERSLKECRFENTFFFCSKFFDSFTCGLMDDDKMTFIKDFKLIFESVEAKLEEKCGILSLKKGELSPELEEFFKDLDKASKRSIFTSFDYGVFSPQQFSIRIYQKHEVLNPFEITLKGFFGKSDLTYSINFNQIQQLIREHDFKPLALKKQSQALIDFGFEELLKYIKDKNLKTYGNLLSQSKILFFNFDEKFHSFEFARFWYDCFPYFSNQALHN